MKQKKKKANQRRRGTTRHFCLTGGDGKKGPLGTRPGEKGKTGREGDNRRKIRGKEAK